MEDKIMDFQSEAMKKKGATPEWGLFQVIARHPGGPAKGIDGRVYHFPPSAMWERVPGSPVFESKQAAYDFFG